MRIFIARWTPLVVAVLSAGCFRYVEEVRPLTAADCPPEPPSRAFIRVSRDSAAIGMITGRVFDADNVEPKLLAAAVVTVLGTRRGGVSDSVGHFQVDSILTGRYAIRVRRLGYRSRIDSVVVTDSFGQAIDVGLIHQPLDGCPGFMARVTRKRAWRWL